MTLTGGALPIDRHSREEPHTMNDDPMRTLLESGETIVKPGNDVARGTALASLLVLFTGLMSIGAAVVVTVIAFAIVLAPLIGLLLMFLG